ncbi:hypothetical protein CC78DRAFT_168114 [Lojkania enalia]|uniref:Uncharacterized protein n=1 Tax=Lojkania enalia TaxID=147567 RepID=A0A9P4KDY7_9PLEO|nr:hypothetical protein CC78DRAFT_168114 [Didymosphaeria enalia]
MKLIFIFLTALIAPITATPTRHEASFITAAPRFHGLPDMTVDKPDNNDRDGCANCEEELKREYQACVDLSDTHHTYTDGRVDENKHCEMTCWKHACFLNDAENNPCRGCAEKYAQCISVNFYHVPHTVIGE